MAELDDILSRDPDSISPAPTSRSADRPFLLLVAAGLLFLLTSLVAALAAGDGSYAPFALGWGAAGGLLVWAGSLLWIDYEDSVNWLVFHYLNPRSEPGRSVALETHDQRRSVARAIGAVAVVMGILVGAGAIIALSS